MKDEMNEVRMFTDVLIHGFKEKPLTPLDKATLLAEKRVITTPSGEICRAGCTITSVENRKISYIRGGVEWHLHLRHPGREFRKIQVYPKVGDLITLKVDKSKFKTVKNNETKKEQQWHTLEN